MESPKPLSPTSKKFRSKSALPARAVDAPCEELDDDARGDGGERGDGAGRCGGFCGNNTKQTNKQPQTNPVKRPKNKTTKKETQKWSRLCREWEREDPKCKDCWSE